MDLFFRYIPLIIFNPGAIAIFYGGREFFSFSQIIAAIVASMFLTGSIFWYMKIKKEYSSIKSYIYSFVISLLTVVFFFVLWIGYKIVIDQKPAVIVVIQSEQFTSGLEIKLKSFYFKKGITTL